MNKCYVCQGDNHFYGKVAGYRILKCKKCGFGQTNVTDDDVKNFYDASYFFGDKATYSQMQEGELDEVGKAWVDDYIDSSNLNLLEIGPGPSTAIFKYLTSTQKKIHYEVVEISSDASSIISNRGIVAHVGKVYDEKILKTIEDRFDCVIATEVIEHDLNPRAFIQGIYKALRMNGTAYLTTGNFDGLYARIKGLRWYYLDPPAHVVFYTPKSIELLFLEAGFRQVKIDTTGGAGVRKLLNRYPIPGMRWMIGFFQIPTGMTIVAIK